MREMCFVSFLCELHVHQVTARMHMRLMILFCGSEVDMRERERTLADIDLKRHPCRGALRMHGTTKEDEKLGLGSSPAEDGKARMRQLS